MKDNTYIIPAISFCVVIPQDSSDQFYSLDDAVGKIKLGKCKFIPFEQVDGLTIDEITSMPNFSMGFAVCSINKIEFEFESSKVIYDINNVFDTLFFPKMEKLIPTIDKTIDKLVEENFELNYKKVTARQRQIYNSFFEKYQDGSYQKTKERVEKILGENNRK